MISSKFKRRGSLNASETRPNSGKLQRNNKSSAQLGEKQTGAYSSTAPSFTSKPAYKRFVEDRSKLKNRSSHLKNISDSNLQTTKNLSSLQLETTLDSGKNIQTNRSSIAKFLREEEQIRRRKLNSGSPIQIDPHKSAD